MNHEVVSSLLDDFVAGALPRDQSSEVEEHLGSCAECREVASTIASVRHEVAAHGALLFADHPAPADLARYAATDSGLAIDELARLGGHVRACPTCEHEVAITRRAGARRAPGLKAALARRSGRRTLGSWPAFAPALAALAAILIYPAYLGLVRLPEARHARGRALAEIEALRSRAAESEGARRAAEARAEALARWSGGIPVLLLPASQRGEAEIPALELRPGQPFQPILIDHDLGDRAAWPRAARIGVTLRRLAGGSVAWSLESAVGDLWDARSQSIALLVPAAALAPGEYQLELRAAPAAGEPFYSSRFEVMR